MRWRDERGPIKWLLVTSNNLVNFSQQLLNLSATLECEGG